MSLDFFAEAKDEYKATIMILKNPEEYGVNLDDIPLMKKYAAALKFIIKYLKPPSPSISKEETKQ